MMDSYAILEIPRGSSQEAIKKAFHKLAHIHHPDKGGNAEKFKEISRAYSELKDRAPAPYTRPDVSPEPFSRAHFYTNYGFKQHAGFWQQAQAQADLDASMRDFQDAVNEALRRAKFDFDM